MSKTFDTRVVGVYLTLVVLSLCGSALAQVNSWTNPASAPWEGLTNWSLGVLPDSGQSIMITNAGYKAVGISPSTRANYPNSMTVSNLTVSAPTNALSTLLLNYFGTGTPLEVLDGCTIGTNGSIVNLYAAFEVGGQWIINGGQYVEQGGLTIATNGRIQVLGGSIELSNAVFEVWLALYGGTVPQTEGQTSGKIGVYGGTYNLLSGTVAGECVVDEGGFFNQYAGTNLAALSEDYMGGTYVLYGGAVNSSQASFSGGIFEQFGGFATFGDIRLWGTSFPGGHYSMTNGTLLSGTVDINIGYFTQSGGQHTNSGGMGIVGQAPTDYTGPYFGSYNLSAGELSSPGIGLGPYGNFYQSGGTNNIQGDLYSVSSYSLSGGVLLTSNTVLDTITSYTQLGYETSDGTFYQTGGQHWVANTLSNLDYMLWGGTLYASNIVLAGTLSVSNSALILNPGLFQFEGTLQLSDGSIENLGQMLLSSNSVIEFRPGSHKLSFLNSAAMNWNQTCSLTVVNWNGSTNGGGSDQLMFGNSSSGLTPAQLRQIVFVNPAGFPGGNYPANVLPSGEVVPLPNPLLSWQNMQGQLVMSWAGQPSLQSSTNLLGPYVDLTNASSPYTNSSSQGPYRFFRLRR